MSLLQARVMQVRNEAEDIRSFRLVSATGEPLPPFTAGSHIDVHIGPGIARQYSLANSPLEAGEYLIAVKKEPQSRGGSLAMHARVGAGDVLKISPPRNNFRLEPGASRHLLFGGGIGITPLLSMAHQLDSTGTPYELHYFSRSVRHTAFHAELSDAAHADKVRFHHALEPEAVRELLRRHLAHRPPGAHLYLCGPRPFMDMVEQAAATWPREAVHLEYFSADPAALAGARKSFVVRLARRNLECTIGEEESICEALFDQGVRIESMCAQGVCGTCVTGVLEGIPDHRDAFLTAEEKASNARIMPCVSRAKSEVLVLDL